MSEKRVAYVSCDYTNRESLVLVNSEGQVIKDPNPDDYNVIGFHHSGGHSECEDWMNWNRELVAELKDTVISTLDLAVSPREAVVQDPPIATFESEEVDSSELGESGDTGQLEEPEAEEEELEEESLEESEELDDLSDDFPDKD